MTPIILIFRKPFPGQVSIEYLFNNISDCLKFKDIAITNVQLPYHSNSVLNRLLNIKAVLLLKKRIIHVTGDAHYAILGAIFCKRILTIHDFNFMLNKTMISRSIYWLLWIYLPVKFSHRVTVVSQSTKGELLKFVKVRERKIVVISNFIDDIYKPTYKVFNSQTPRLLQVGTTFNKNLRRLISAIMGIDCILIIIGNLEKDIVDLLEKNNVQYENKYNLTIEALYEEYAKADILCYVSTSEGFGIPILEAQASGVPVVTSNCSSMPEVAGAGAVFVNPVDVDSIREGITKMLVNKSLREKIIESGYLNANRFSKEVIAEQYLDIYRNLENAYLS